MKMKLKTCSEKIILENREAEKRISMYKSFKFKKINMMKKNLTDEYFTIVRIFLSQKNDII